MDKHYYYVYIMTNSGNTVLYIGVTDDLMRRVYEHKNKLIPGFTAKYNISKLVYYEVTESPVAAIEREKRLKHWKREWKIKIIEESNPCWEDLADNLQ